LGCVGNMQRHHRPVIIDSRADICTTPISDGIPMPKNKRWAKSKTPHLDASGRMAMRRVLMQA
jgi:hypothetical protein